MKFFVVALPGLEDIVRAEVAEWFPDLEAKSEHGGINVIAPLERGLSMNLVLKTPTRILLRVKEFRCRDFPSLYKTVKGVDWSQYIDPSCEWDVQVSTRLSRLKIKSRIEETCLDAATDYRVERKVTAVRGKKVALYVRFVEDVCTLSLDTSGERLHKRGDRTWVGEAPLRETIAAALLQLVERTHAWNDHRPVEIIDPMVGSGTFLLEAATYRTVIDGRDFAFKNFSMAPVVTPEAPGAKHEFVRLIGFEKDKKTLAAARENLSGVRNLDLHNEDFFKAEPLPATEAQRWVFCNPPYGERLKVKEPLADLYVRLFAAVEEKCRPDWACFLLPSKAVKGKFKLPVGWKVYEKRPFVNGGIPVTAFVFGRLGARPENKLRDR